MSFLRQLESFVGMFQCLLRVLMSGLVILFSVVRGGGAVRVCGVFVKFGSSLVRVVWHCFPILGCGSDLTYNRFFSQNVRFQT